MAAMSINSQIFTNLFSLETQTYDIDAWHVASKTQVLQNDDHGLTVTYFTARTNLVAFAFNGETFTKTSNRRNL